MASLCVAQTLQFLSLSYSIHPTCGQVLIFLHTQQSQDLSPTAILSMASASLISSTVTFTSQVCCTPLLPARTHSACSRKGHRCSIPYRLIPLLNLSTTSFLTLSLRNSLFQRSPVQDCSSIFSSMFLPVSSANKISPCLPCQSPHTLSCHLPTTYLLLLLFLQQHLYQGQLSATKVVRFPTGLCFTESKHP